MPSSDNRSEAKADSSHLRRVRAIKSKYGRPNKIRTARYEVIRVLGKGSFGVVKLVREIHRDSSGGDTDIHQRVSEASSTSENRLVPHERDLASLKKQIYAMKVIRKSEMLCSSQDGHIRAERDFLVASAHSPWVVPLISAFQDHNHLYLVMEYMVGGDFLNLLMREDILSEPHARWYIAEMILCVEETHKMNWIHRDIKPDNFLMGANGHLKISDFGLAFDGHWAHWQQYHNNTREELLERCNVKIVGDAEDVKRDMKSVQTEEARAVRPIRPETNDMIIDHLNKTCRRRLAKSMVGTSQYMAPEIVSGDYYDGRCDWWSIGVILYECLYGFTPFHANTRDDTKKRIGAHRTELLFPIGKRIANPQTTRTHLPPVTPPAIDLITSLLTERERRLSCRRYRENDSRGRRSLREARYRPKPHAYFVYPNDAEDIKAHHFFKNFDWDNLHRSHPPDVPRISSNQPITKYFDDEKDIISSLDISSSEESFESVSKETVSSLHCQAQPAAFGGDGAATGATATLLSVPQLLRKASAPLLNRQKPGRSAKNTMMGVHCPVEIRMPFYEERKPLLYEPDTKLQPENGKATNTRQKRQKEKRRPRDKILRDPKAAKEAMEIRKAVAFLGYTYRRPDMSGSLYSNGRSCMIVDRRPRTRPSILPLVNGAMEPAVGFANA